MSSHTFQQEFDNTYISSCEICRRLNVTRSQLLYMRRRHEMPPSIKVGDGKGWHLWFREEIEPFLQHWESALQLRRSVKPIQRPEN